VFSVTTPAETLLSLAIAARGSMPLPFRHRSAYPGRLVRTNAAAQVIPWAAVHNAGQGSVGIGAFRFVFKHLAGVCVNPDLERLAVALDVERVTQTGAAVLLL
jgi:hypothetical protein